MLHILEILSRDVTSLMRGSMDTRIHGNMGPCNNGWIKCFLTWIGDFIFRCQGGPPSPFKSDHRLLMLQFVSPSRSSQRRRPFWFLASWLTHPEFHLFMQHHWKPDEHWPSRVFDFQDDILKWNKDKFRNIFKRKQ